MHKHTTKEGQVMYISAMGDTHLYNTIGYFSRALIELGKRLRNPDAADPVREAMYGRVVPTIDEYRDLYNRWSQRIGPYLIEAALRDISVSEIIAEVTGRNEQDRNAPSLDPVTPRIACNKFDDEDEFEEQEEGASWVYKQ